MFAIRVIIQNINQVKSKVRGISSLGHSPASDAIFKPTRTVHIKPMRQAQLDQSSNLYFCKFGTVVFMGRGDLPEGFIWELFNDQKNQFAKGDMVYGYRDHIPGLPPTCYEAMYVAQSYEFVQCIKDDVIIFVMTNYGDS